MCDAQHLPFRDSIFETVISRQVIEHVVDPLKMIDELHRVSNYKIIVECPFGLADKLAGPQSGHISFFSTKWFKKYARVRRLVVTIKITKFMENRIGLFLNIPLEIQYEFQKQE